MRQSLLVYRIRCFLAVDAKDAALFLQTPDEILVDSRIMLMLMEKAQEIGGYDAWQPHPDHYDLPLCEAIMEACIATIKASI